MFHQTIINAIIEEENIPNDFKFWSQIFNLQLY